MRTLIYQGPGVAPSFRPALAAQFPNALWIDHRELLAAPLIGDLLVFPGGRDRLYHAKLKGAGNRRIREFVEQGGTYLGICAGAYYGATHVLFEQGNSLEVDELRELSFFPGQAVGPAYGLGLFEYRSNRGARAALLSDGKDSFHAYYIGGPTFQGDLSETIVHAVYDDLPGKPPAIIEQKIGRGRAILSGVHFEVSTPFLDPQDPFLTPWLPLLEQSENKRKKWTKKFLSQSSQNPSTDQVKMEVENGLPGVAAAIR